MSEPQHYSPIPGEPTGPGMNAPAPDQTPYPSAAPQPTTPAPDLYAPTSSHQPPNPYDPSPVAGPAAPVGERVGRGLALALLAIPVAAGVAALIWRLGFIASISSFVLAGAAALLYAKGSGGIVRKGIPGVIAIIVIGTAVSWFAVVATDIAMYYPKLNPAGRDFYPTRGSFVADNLFDGPVLRGYLKDLGLFVLFAALGTFGVIRRLVQVARSRA